MKEKIIGSVYSVGFCKLDSFKDIFHICHLFFTEFHLVFLPIKNVSVSTVGPYVHTGAGFSQMEYALKKYAENPGIISPIIQKNIENSKDEIDGSQGAFGIKISDIESIHISTVFMSTISYLCQIKLFQKKPTPLGETDIIDVYINKKFIEEAVTLFKRTCRSKVLVDYKQYTGKRWVSYLLFFASILTLFLGFILAMAMNSFLICLPISVLGIVLIIAFYLYAFKKKKSF
jgi:hypothetical protein